MAKEEVAAPTTADQVAMGKAGGEAAIAAAEKGATPEQTAQASAHAVREVANERGFKFTEEDAEMFSRVLIKQLEAVGAFDSPPEPVAAPEVTVEQQAEAVAVTPPAAAVEAPPRHRTFAEKFRGAGR